MAVEEKPASGARSGKINVGRHLIKFGLNPAALAYAMTTLGSSMINNIFSFYYVKLFLNKYKISEGAFHQSQVSICYLIFFLCKCMSVSEGLSDIFGAWQNNNQSSCLLASVWINIFFFSTTWHFIFDKYLHRWCTWCGMRSMTLSLATCKIIPGCPAALSGGSQSCMVLPSIRWLFF